MDLGDKNRIIASLPYLCDNTTDLPHILTRLLSSFILNSSECDLIQSKPTSSTKCMELYTIIQKKPPKAFKILIKILIETGNPHLAEKILGVELSEDETILAQQLLNTNDDALVFDLDDPSENFTGRQKELENLHLFLQGENRKLTLICGLGGVGKTELARCYAKHKKYFYDGNVVWIKAENTSTLRLSFLSLCERLNLTIRNENSKPLDDKYLVDKVYRFLKPKSCLFIFDNAEYYQNKESPEKTCKRFLPSPMSDFKQFSFLFTTKNFKFHSSAHIIELNSFTFEESFVFLKNNLSIETNDEDLEKLHDHLQGLPLVLQQAVSFIENKNEQLKDIGMHSGYTIQECLDVFTNEGTKILDFNIPENTDNTYTKTALTTWKASIASIEAESKKKQEYELAPLILSICAYLYPEIDVGLFDPLVRYKRIELAPALQIPKNYSLYSYRNGRIQIHRLVQKVIRLNFQHTNEEVTILNKVSQLILEPLFFDKFSPTNYMHCISVWDHNVKYPNLVKNFSNLPWLTAQLMIKGAHYEEAKEFCEQVIPALKKVFHSEQNNFAFTHDATLTTFMMARALHEIGKYPEALKTFLEVYEQHRSTPFVGTEHPDALRTRINIASVLASQSKYDDALSQSLEVLELQQSKLEPDDAAISQTQSIVAFILEKQGEYDKALEVYEHVYSTRLKEHGESHLDTLTIKSNIANLQTERGDFEGALNIYENVFSNKKKILGVTHPETLSTAHNIAHVQRKMGKFLKALELYDAIINNEDCPLKLDHPLMLEVLHGKATVLLDLEKFVEARDLFTEIVFKKSDILGDTHHSTLHSKVNLAIALKNLQEYEEALRLYDVLITDCEIVLGKKHFDTVGAKLNKGIALMELGRLDEAFVFIQETCQIRFLLYGIHNPYTLKSLENKALCLHKMKKHDHAFEIYNDILKYVEALYGDDGPETLGTKLNFANVLEKQGKIAEPMKMYEDIFNAQKLTMLVDHPAIQRTIQNLTLFYEDHKMYPKMRLFFQELLELSEKSLGTIHAVTINSKLQMARVYHLFQNYTHSMKICDEIFSILSLETSLIRENAFLCEIFNIHARIFKANAQRKLRNYENSLAEYDCALEMTEKLLGKESQLTLKIRHEKTNVFRSQKLYSHAYYLFVQIYKMQCEYLGRENTDTVITLSSIANIFRLQGKYKQSLIINNHIHNLRVEVQGENHPDTLRSLTNFAITCMKAKKFQLALFLLKKVFQVLTTHLNFPNNHPQVIVTKQRYKNALHETNDWIYTMANLLYFINNFHRNANK